MSFISSDSTIQINLKVSDNIWVLEEGVNLVTNLNAMDGSGSWSSREIFINGNVMTGAGGMGVVLGAFQHASSGDLISIGATGSLYAGQIGVLAYDDDFTLHDSGIVHAGSATISSAQAVSVAGTGCRIENSGTISVDGQGLALSLQSGTAVVTNSGLIEATDGAAVVIGGTATVINTGTIIGGSAGQVAIETAGGEAEVHNTGTIVGKIELGDAADHFHTNGGTIDGVIILGGGDDEFYSQRATIDGTIYGGLGDDDYHVDDAGLQLLENAGQGTDTVYASISYRLGANIENLVLTGHAALSGTGNRLDNVLVGNDAGNLLDGGRGTDTVDYGNSDAAVSVSLATGKGLGGTAEGDRLRSVENLTGSAFSDQLTGNAAANVLSGLGGDDVLTGLGGKDVFYFSDFAGKDTVTDYTTGEDRLQIEETGIGSFHAVKSHMSQHGTDVIIDFSAIHAGDELVIRNAQKVEFHASDILIV